MTYMKPLGALEIFLYIAAIIYYLAALPFIYTGLYYVSSLLKQMRLSHAESIKLLNSMHEGLLILKNPKRHAEQHSVMFCN